MLHDDLTPSPIVQWLSITLIVALSLLILIGAGTVLSWLR